MIKLLFSEVGCSDLYIGVSFSRLCIWSFADPFAILVKEMSADCEFEFSDLYHQMDCVLLSKKMACVTITSAFLTLS